MTEETRKQTLDDVRNAIVENDRLRLEAGITDDVRAGLDKAALALRTLERELVAETSEDIVDRLEKASETLTEMARDIRDRVSAMNIPAKVAGHLKDTAAVIVRFLTEVGRWVR